MKDYVGFRVLGFIVTKANLPEYCEGEMGVIRGVCDRVTHQSCKYPCEGVQYL